jgi:hypothetical protein
VLPIGLVELIVESFQEVMPADASILLRGRFLDVEHADGRGWFNEPLGGLPWPPMPKDLKWRLALQSVYETVARGLGTNGRGGGSGDLFRLLWPVPDARVHVEVARPRISAEFRYPDGTTALNMPDIDWTGPVTEELPRTWALAANPDDPVRHFGTSLRDQDGAQ